LAINQESLHDARSTNIKNELLLWRQFSPVFKTVIRKCTYILDFHGIVSRM